MKKLHLFKKQYAFSLPSPLVRSGTSRNTRHLTSVIPTAGKDVSIHDTLPEAGKTVSPDNQPPCKFTYREIKKIPTLGGGGHT